MGLVAAFVGLLSAWMLWIVHKFAGGDDWFSLIVTLILDELALTGLLFSAVALIWACFAPARLGRILGAALGKLALVASWVGYLLIGGLFVAVPLGGLCIQIYWWVVEWLA